MLALRCMSCPVKPLNNIHLCFNSLNAAIIFKWKKRVQLVFTLLINFTSLKTVFVQQEVGIFSVIFPPHPLFSRVEQPNPDKDLIFNGKKKEGDINKLILPS